MRHHRGALRRLVPWRLGGRALYGRALQLTEMPRLAATAPDHPIARDLRPYRRRLHLQRAAVTLVRALAVATLVATSVLLLRALGRDIALPVVPLVAGGAVLVALAASIPLQRPALPQISRLLDKRLGLYELIGSALEIRGDESRLAVQLHERAHTSLQNANPGFVLPWPSLHRERRGLLVLATVCGVTALFAVHATPARPVALAVAVGEAHGGRHAQTRRAAPGIRPITLPTGLLGHASSIQQPINGPHPGQKPASGTGARRQTAGSGNGQRQLSTGALQIHQAQDHKGGNAPGNPGATGGATRAAAGPAGSKAHAGANSRLGSLHLTASKNSAAGGVISPEQQQLLNLQNSITLAQNGSPHQNGNNAGSQSSTPRQGQGSKNGGTGKNGGARGAPNGRQPTANGSGNPYQNQQSRNGQSPYQASSAAAARAAYGRRGSTGEFDPRNRFSHGAGPGDSQGSDAGTSTPALRSGGAQLGADSNVTLNGTSNRAGHLVVSVGGTQRVAAQGTGSTSSATTNPIVTVPGYVAPDSNDVAPQDRSAVQGYFSPAPNSN